jgi:hypothetical protein
MYVVEVRMAEDRLFEVRPVEVRPAEVRSAEVCRSEVYLLIGMGASLGVPRPGPTLEDGELLLIRHRLLPAYPGLARASAEVQATRPQVRRTVGRHGDLTVAADAVQVLQDAERGVMVDKLQDLA